MVASWPSKRNDSRRPQLLSIGSVGRFGHVTKLVAQSWVAELSRWDVALLPTLAVGLTILLAEQSQLRAGSFRQSIVFADKPVVQPDQHDLLTDVTALLADVAELQPDVTELLAQLVVFSIVAVVQPDESKVPGNEPGLLGFVFTNKSLLADFTIIQPDIAGLLTDQPQLLAFESQLFSAFAAVLVNNTEL